MPMTSQTRFFFFSDMEKLGNVFPQKWKLVKFTQGKQKNSQLYCQMNKWQNLLEKKTLFLCSYCDMVCMDNQIR
jgi:hypothetical protein